MGQFYLDIEALHEEGEFFKVDHIRIVTIHLQAQLEYILGHDDVSVVIFSSLAVLLTDGSVTVRRFEDYMIDRVKLTLIIDLDTHQIELKRGLFLHGFTHMSADALQVDRDKLLTGRANR